MDPQVFQVLCLLFSGVASVCVALIAYSFMRLEKDVATIRTAVASLELKLATGYTTRERSHNLATDIQAHENRLYRLETHVGLTT